MRATWKEKTSSRTKKVSEQSRKKDSQKGVPLICMFWPLGLEETKKKIREERGEER